MEQAHQAMLDKQQLERDAVEQHARERMLMVVPERMLQATDQQRAAQQQRQAVAQQRLAIAQQQQAVAAQQQAAAEAEYPSLPAPVRLRPPAEQQQEREAVERLARDLRIV